MKYPMNKDMIRKRFEEAIVVQLDGEIHILLPQQQHHPYEAPQYFSLTEGTYNWTDAVLDQCDWVIRPGDTCQMSDDRVHWYEKIFNGFNPESSVYIFTTSPTAFKYARPISTRLRKIQELESSMLETQRKLNELKRLEEK